MKHAQKEPSPEDLLTPTEVAEIWKTSEETVRRFCRLGLLTHSRVGALYRIRRADADAYLSSRTRKAN